MSDFDMYILPLLCNQNDNYYCWSSMIMSSYFNMFAPKNNKDFVDPKICLHQKMIRILSLFADIVQHFSRAFPNFWRECISIQDL